MWPSVCGASEENQKHEGESISGQSLIEMDFGPGGGETPVIVSPASGESAPAKQPTVASSTAKAKVP